MEFEWKTTVEGLRPISKKNSRIISRNRSLPSAAYKKFNAEALRRLKDQVPATPYTGHVIVEIELHLKGKIWIDTDNALTSWLDTIEDAGVIANDRQVLEAHVYVHLGAKDWRSDIHVVSFE